MTTQRRSRTHAQADILGVLAITLCVFALSSHFELHETIAAQARRFEAWQADEVPMSLLALSIGLAWYAWRRRREAGLLLSRNRELAQQLIAVQEHERRALARELHDEMAQHCTAIRIEAAYLQRAQDASQIIASAQRSAATAELLYEGVRRLLRRLRPAELDELGLVPALQALCEHFETRSGLSCRFAFNGVAGPMGSLGEAIDTAVYRVAQEALSNSMRHAKAANVSVSLICTAAAVVLQVEDDGRGFDPQSRHGTRGLGLLGATERAAALGGELTVISRPGAGTCLRLWVPRVEAAAEPAKVPA